ncbi:hypothetical protein EDD11_004368 [Mortierella claussenii]|nr:hypothetical protein EDD11_004368 [Mortierella claussenii]
MRGPGAGWTGEDCGDPRWDKNKRSKKDNATSTNDSCEAMSHSGAVFRAHKCVLETTSFFHRMLNGEFKEAQADENGKYRIEISSDIFDAEIMDYLLDYIYTKEPIADGLEASSSPTLKHWGAFYRAAVVLEDKELQAQMLQQIQLHLDPDSTLDQVLTWGHEHEDVKMVMLQYLVQKRREIFGDEQYNKLRPYFWAEYEEQVETLVEITSQIARQ